MDSAAPITSKVVSVQVATPTVMNGSNGSMLTAIQKEQVSSAFVGRLGLTGDEVADKKHHGGLDAAVYVYAAEDYEFWEAELGTTLAKGTFGENITIDSYGSEPLRIGDRFALGEAVLEVTSARIPCITFTSRMGLPGWVARFREARRPGFYSRVIEEGIVGAGDHASRLPATEEHVEMLEVLDLFYDRDASDDRLRAAIAGPIAVRVRADLERRLAR